MIPNKYIHIKEKESLTEDIKETISDDSIGFIADTGTLYHHGKEFLQPTWDEIGYPPSHTICYTTNDGNIIKVHDYWEQPIINKYDKEKDKGIMIFKNPLTEIPGVSGHPFFFSQTNLLTVKLPKTIKKLGQGCFYGCSNLYYINVEELALTMLGWGCFEQTGIKNLDFRKSIFTSLGQGSLQFGTTVDYVLCPTSITDVGTGAFNYADIDYKGTKIKTLMIPTLNRYGNYYVENVITENLIINKFDGLADLHYFNTDCIIWVPDEWYDAYIEYYTNNTSYSNWQDIVSRLKRYSEGVPEFPSK